MWQGPSQVERVSFDIWERDGPQVSDRDWAADTGVLSTHLPLSKLVPWPCHSTRGSCNHWIGSGCKHMIFCQTHLSTEYRPLQFTYRLNHMTCLASNVYLPRDKLYPLPHCANMKDFQVLNVLRYLSFYMQPLHNPKGQHDPGMNQPLEKWRMGEPHSRLLFLPK